VAGPTTLSVTGGTLPPGLTFNPATGLITGTPTTVGTFYFNLTATNGDGETATHQYSITIVAAPPVFTPSHSRLVRRYNR
jgi:hypothetical protein